MCEYLSPRHFLLAKEKGVEGNVSDLNNLEPNSGNITDGVTLTTKTSNQDFVIFFNKVQTTILWYESSDLLTVLDQLYTDALSDGRVRLLSLNADLFKNDSLGVRSSSERIGLPTGSQMGFLVIFVSPDLVTAIVHVLTSSTKTTWLTHFEKTEKVSSFTNKTSTGKGPM